MNIENMTVQEIVSYLEQILGSTINISSQTLIDYIEANKFNMIAGEIVSNLLLLILNIALLKYTIDICKYINKHYKIIPMAISFMDIEQANKYLNKFNAEELPMDNKENIVTEGIEKLGEEFKELRPEFKQVVSLALMTIAFIAILLTTINAFEYFINICECIISPEKIILEMLK